MNVNNLFRAKDLATETSDAMRLKLDDRQKLCLYEAVVTGRERYGLHVDDVGRAYVVADAAARALFEVNMFDHSIS
jgi:tRNA C32,U32 (ribose-2'-O)-methylase TrmJ